LETVEDVPELEEELVFFPAEELTLAFAEESVLLQPVAIIASRANTLTSSITFWVFILLVSCVCSELLKSGSLSRINPTAHAQL
jgi:hypothetical protein